jgi:hypothetical protein
MMSLRRVLTLALLVPVLAPSVRGLADLAVDGIHSCAEGLCRCHHARPAAPQAPAACHERAAPSKASCQMSARCNHEGPTAPGTPSFTLGQDTRTLALDDAPAPAPPEPVSAVREGFSRLDSPPPRLT